MENKNKIFCVENLTLKRNTAIELYLRSLSSFDFKYLRWSANIISQNHGFNVIYPKRSLIEYFNFGDYDNSSLIRSISLPGTGDEKIEIVREDLVLLSTTKRTSLRYTVKSESDSIRSALVNIWEYSLVYLTKNLE